MWLLIRIGISNLKLNHISKKGPISLTLGNKFQWQLKQDTIVVHNNEIENTACKMSAILSQQKCIKASIFIEKHIICLILMNYLMEFYFIGFVNAHLPGCFCPWTFRLNIGLNTSPSDSFVSYLNSHLGYSAGEFQALQLIVLAVFGAVD